MNANPNAPGRDALQLEVDALKRLQAESRLRLEQLLPSVLDHAFKGAL
jgi:hypothetical protein